MGAFIKLGHHSQIKLRLNTTLNGATIRIIKRKTMGDLSWRDRAACKGVDTKIFFPHDTLRQNRWDEGLESTAFLVLSGCLVLIWLCRLILLMIVGVCLVVCCRVNDGR